MTRPTNGQGLLSAKSATDASRPRASSSLPTRSWHSPTSEEQVRITANPLAVTNRASELSGSMMRAMQAGEIDIALNHFSNDYVFDDHRRLSGDPIPGKVELRAAAERILQQFSRFERRVLAVRGERLSLAWSRWSDAAGNETSYLHVYELGDDDLIARDIRFDEDDFEGAYRELEARYYAGEGAAFAEYGRLQHRVSACDEPRRLRHHVRRAGPARTCALKTGPAPYSPIAPPRNSEHNFEDLYAMVKSVRSWFSALHWLSPTSSCRPPRARGTRTRRRAVRLDMHLGQPIPRRPARLDLRIRR